MSGRFSRSWALVKASARVLRSERKLLLFPLLSGLCSLIVVASFVLPVIGSGALHGMAQQHGGGFSATGYVTLFVFYLVQYTVIFFFNTALVGAVMVHLEGGRASVGDALRATLPKLPQILGYAAIAATVGMVLRALEKRLGLIGRLVIGLVGVAWTVATFLVVPILAATDQGPVDAVKHSTQLLKRTWGENIIGNLGLGLVFGVLTVLLAIVAMMLFTMVNATHSAALLALLIGAVVLGFVLLALVQTTLQSIYSAALYRYAEYGEVDNGFDGALMDAAFRTKR